MRKQEAIERLCKLLADVGTNVFDNKEPYDCICGHNKAVWCGAVCGEPIVSEEVIKFIEQAVTEAVDNWAKSD